MELAQRLTAAYLKATQDKELDQDFWTGVVEHHFTKAQREILTAMGDKEMSATLFGEPEDDNEDLSDELNEICAVIDEQMRAWMDLS